MTDNASVSPDPVRTRFAQSLARPGELADVAAAVSEVTRSHRTVYVERHGDHFRWSFVHAGGAYPLLRTVAQFLGLDHRKVLMGFTTLPDGRAVVTGDPASETEPDEWAVLDFDEHTEANNVASTISAAFPGHVR